MEPDQVKKFKVTVKMKKPWIKVDEWVSRPNTIDVLERFLDETAHKELRDCFEIAVEEVGDG